MTLTKLIRFSGVTFIDRGLSNGEQVHVTVTAEDGTEIGSGIGTVVARTDRPKKRGDGSELVHSVKVT